MSTRSPALCSVLLVVLFAGCTSPPPKDTKYPPRPEGCDVKVYPEAPSEQTENIGTVNASCAETVTDEECFRTLKDEACKLGADVVWGVDPKPTLALGKKKLSGRAAHTKAPGSSSHTAN